MTRTSQTKAWQQVSARLDVDAARISGRCLRRATVALIPPGRLAPDAARQLHDSVYRPRGTPAVPHSIWYVVSVDATPVAWLTYHATVVTPPAQLNDYQLQAQQRAVTALTELTRRALIELALLRDTREHRTPGDSTQWTVDGAEVKYQPARRVLVADPADPTLTFWAAIAGDLHATRAHLATVAGMPDTAAGSPRILDVHGFGAYGLYRDTYDLAVLCAIVSLADQHGLSAETIGDWLHREGADATQPTAPQITDAFSASYRGIHHSRRHFAMAERDRLGWTAALAAASIPDRFFDVDGFLRWLFEDRFHGVPVDATAAVAVFRRS